MREDIVVLKDRYEIREKLGKGGSAQVYAAYDREKERKRAVKEIKKTKDSFQAEQIRRMVQRETELIKRLHYPYFPAVEEVMETDEACYIVMEYLEGETLDKTLERLGPLPWQEVLGWMKDLCLILGYLHECQPPVIYCDMKPGNLMLQPDGNLRLIDFGAVWECREEETEEKIRLGTRGYAAPEQFSDSGKIDARTDIYGLGATMYHLLTGKDPGKFSCQKYSVQHWNFRLPRKLEKIVKKCTKIRPEERYQSCKEILADLENFANRRKLWYNNRVEK